MSEHQRRDIDLETKTVENSADVNQRSEVEPVRFDVEETDALGEPQGVHRSSEASPEWDDSISLKAKPWRHPLQTIAWCVQCSFGIATLVLILALVAAIPIVNFIALGYLLEAERRMALTGKIRHSIPLLKMAPRAGVVGIGLLVFLFPLHLLSSAAADARLIDAESQAAIVLSRMTIVGSVLVGIHLCLALFRGGRVGDFLRPWRNTIWLFRSLRDRSFSRHADQQMRRLLSRLQLGYYLSLGWRGYIGGIVWLLIPTLLFAAGDGQNAGAGFAILVGGVGLVFVLSWAPFLQVQFSVENRLAAMFELRKVKRLYSHAPLAWAAVTLLFYLSALPLYLFTVVVPSADAMWLVTIVFIISIFPSKLAVGWAYHRAMHREEPTGRKIRFLSRALILATLCSYVFLLFFTQFVGQHGKLVLFEHHALLLPVPVTPF